MILKQYLILMSFGTVICWAAWIFVLLSVDPNYAGFLGFLFFYLSFFLAILGTFSVVGFMIKRKMINNDEVIFRHVKRTFRQAAIAAILFVTIFLFLQMKILSWWNGLLLIVLFALLEGIIFTHRKHSNCDYKRFAGE